MKSNLTDLLKKMYIAVSVNEVGLRCDGSQRKKFNNKTYCLYMIYGRVPNCQYFELNEQNPTFSNCNYKN